LEVPVSENVRNLLFFTGLRKHKVFMCDTSKKFFYQTYNSWSLENGVLGYSYSSFYQKTNGWLRKAKVRDGVCIHCHLSEDIVNKIKKKGIESLGEGEKNNYMLYSIHKVCLVFKHVLFLQRTAEIIHKYIVDLIKYLKENETITFIDYKENITLVIVFVETQAWWFHKTNVTILGFLTIYGEKDKQSKKLIRTVHRFLLGGNI
jgi:hypothetical protein